MTHTLDARLLEAHAKGDRSALIGLYAEAAEASPDSEEAAFFYTQAYVFALETGSPRAPVLRSRLVSLGSETPE